MNRTETAAVSAEVAAVAADWFARLQEEEASEQDFQAWQRWLSAAPEHARAYRDIERAWRLIGEVKPMPAGVPVSSHNRRVLRWALAASVMLLAGTALAVYWMNLRGAHYSTEIAEQRSLRLPDGSRVTLGARSSIKPMFSAQARSVVLESGEAFFEVANDPARPFTVAAGGSAIRAVGTAFNVHSARDRVLVSVTEGRVAVVSQDHEVLLSAGEQAAVSAAGIIEDKGPAPRAVTWLHGRLEYQGERLRHVVEDLNRYTDRPIVLTDESLEELRYSGTVFPDHLDEWLQGVSGALPLRVRDTGKQRQLVPL